MFDALMLLLCGAFLCWFIRAAYIHTMDMEYIYHLDEYHAKEQKDTKSSSRYRKIDEMEI